MPWVKRPGGMAHQWTWLEDDAPESAPESAPEQAPESEPESKPEPEPTPEPNEESAPDEPEESDSDEESDEDTDEEDTDDDDEPEDEEDEEDDEEDEESEDDSDEDDDEEESSSDSDNDDNETPEEPEPVSPAEPEPIRSSGLFVADMSYPELLSLMRETDSSVYTGKVRSNNPQTRSIQSAGESWAGGAKTLADAISIMERGWPEGMEYVRDVALPTVNHLSSIIAPTGGWSWDVTGSSYDTGEYLSGEPECWLVQAEETIKPTIDIRLDAFLSWSISDVALRMRGAAIVALTLALEQAGYVVRVSTTIGCDSTTVYGKSCWARVVLTDDNGGALDVDRLLFMLAHPAGTRWIMFNLASRTMQHTPKEYGRECYSSGISHPCPFPANLVIPKMVYGDPNFESPQAIEAWVKRTFLELTTRPSD